MASSGLPPNSLAGLAVAIFADFLTTITEDICLEAHRSEKIIRMNAIRASLQSSIPTAAEAANASVMAAKQMGRALDVAFRDEICPRCLLPRHTPETLAAPPVPGKLWCTKLPIHDAPGCDIHGNPIISSGGNSSGRGKGNRNVELANDRMSPFTDVSAPTPPAPHNGGKAANNNNPYVQCSLCERDIACSRYAAHLEKCSRRHNPTTTTSGRTSSRAATARVNNASGIGTPSLGSSSRLDSPANAVSPASSGNVDENGGISVATSNPKKSASGGDKKSAAPKKKLVKKEKLGLDLADKPSVAAAIKMEKTASSQTIRATNSETPPPNSQVSASTATVQKKKKRKAEALEGDGDGHSKERDKTVSGEKGSNKKDKDKDKDKEKEKDKDKEGISSSKPHGKKQKLAAGSGQATPTSGSTIATQPKSQISKLKNPAGSPTPSKSKLGGVEMHRSHTDTSIAGSHAESGTSLSPPPSIPLGLKGSPTKTPTKLSSSMTQASPKISKASLSSGLGGAKVSKEKKADRDKDRTSSEHFTKDSKDGSHRKEKSGKPKPHPALAGTSTPKASGLLGGKEGSPEKKKVKPSSKIGTSPSGKGTGHSVSKGIHRSESPSVTGKHSFGIGGNSNGKRERDRDDGSTDSGMSRKKSKGLGEDNDDQF